MRSHGINARQVLEEINLHALCFVNKFTCGSNLLPTLHFPECSDLCIYLALLNYMPLIQLLYFFCSVALSYPTLCNFMNFSIPGFPVFHYLPEFAQTHVHWVDDAIQPSSDPLSSAPFSSCLLYFPALRYFSMNRHLTSDAQNTGAPELLY